MNAPRTILFGCLISCLGVGCAEKANETKARDEAAARAKEESAAKARADAARKEMETLPKVFSTPDYLKKNKPEPSAATVQPEPVKK